MSCQKHLSFFGLTKFEQKSKSIVMAQWNSWECEDIICRIQLVGGFINLTVIIWDFSHYVTGTNGPVS